MSSRHKARGEGSSKYIGSLCIVALIASMFAMVPGSAVAHTPESPRVQAMLKASIDYLHKEKTSEGTFGGKALMAYTLIKAEKAMVAGNNLSPRTRERIQEAVDAIRDALDAADKDPSVWRPVYSPAISVMFLCELDAEKYRPEIQRLLDHLLARQRPDGAWGYYQGSAKWKMGDTSQSQYVVLAFWYAAKNDFQIPNKAVQGLLNFFIRTQMPDGGFAYHVSADGHPEGGAKRTMGVAGTGSIYIIANFTGAISEKKKEKKTQFDDGLPSTVSLFIEGKEDKKRDGHVFQTTGMMAALDKGDRWLSQHPGYTDTGWYLYYMYGYERYRTFYDIAKGSDEDEPEWYNTGVEHLSKLQNSDGSWGESSNYNPAVNSCFAMLFLMRNTRASVAQLMDGAMQGINKLGEGSLRFGPDGNIITTRTSKEVNDLFTMSKSVEPQDWGAFRATMNELKLSNDPKKREAELSKMRTLISHKDFGARIIAVEQLGRRRDFKSVPHLIYALGDPDKRVAIEAHKALRVLSRKFDIADIKDDGSPEYSDSDRETFTKIKNEWKKWYRQRKPDAIFLD